MRTAACLLLLSLAASGREPTLDFDSRVVRDGVHWAVRVEGTAPLPDGARVEGDLYYVQKIDPNAYVPPLETDEEELPVASRSESASGGRFSFQIGPFGREPYPGRWRVRMEYDPDIQPREIAEAAGGGKRIVREKDFVHGAPAELPAVLESVRKELEADYLRMPVLLDDLARRYAAARTRPPPAAGWAGDVGASLDELEGRNALRLDARISEVEPRAKFFLQALIERMRALQSACDGILAEPPGEGERAPREAAIHRSADELRELTQRYFDDLGFVRPADPAKILPLLKALDEAVAGSEGWAARPEAERAPLRAAADAAVHAAVFTLLQEGSAFTVEPLTRLATDWPALAEAAAAGSPEVKGRAETVRKDITEIRRAFGLK